MKIVSKVLEEVQEGDYSKVEPLLHFLRSRGDIAESIDDAWEEEMGEELTKDTLIRRGRSYEW